MPEDLRPRNVLNTSESLSQPQQGVSGFEKPGLRIGKTEREQKYHSIASKVYSVVERMERDAKYQLQSADSEALHEIRDSVSALIEDEDVSMTDALSDVDPTNKQEVQKIKRIAEVNKNKHKALGRYIDKIFEENAARKEGDGKGKLATVAEVKNEKPDDKKFDARQYVDQDLADKEPFKSLEYSKLRGYVADSSKLPSASPELDVLLTALDSSSPLMKALQDEALFLAAEPAKKELINTVVLPGFTNLRTEVVRKRSELQSSKDSREFSTWKANVLQKSPFNELRLKANVSTDVTNFKVGCDLYNELTLSVQSVESAVHQEVASGVPTPFKTQAESFVRDGVLKTGKDKIATIGKNLVSFWEQKYLPSTYQEIANLNSAALRFTTTRSRSTDSMLLYRDLQRNRAVVESKRKNYADSLPVQLQPEGAGYISSLLRTIEDQLIVLKNEAQTKALAEVSALPEMLALRNMNVDGQSPKSDIPGVERQETNINNALKAADVNKIVSMFDVDLQANVRNDVEKEIARSAIILAELNKKKAELQKELAQGKVDLMKGELSTAVSAIIDLDVKIDRMGVDKIGNDEVTLALLLPLQKNLSEAEKKIRNTGKAIEDADGGFARARKKIDELVERAREREMPLSELIDIIIEKNIDPFIAADVVNRLTDPIEKQRILRFQGMYFQATTDIQVFQKDAMGQDTTIVDRRATKEAQREHRKQKVRIWSYRYYDENFGGQYVPGANPDKLYSAMTNRKLFRDDIIEGLMDDPKYGQASRDFLKYAVQIVAEETTSLDGGGRTARDLGISYDDLKANADGPSRLKAHLRDMFVKTGKLPDPSGQQKDPTFDTLWQLYVDFDLASISLVIQQKGTKTRSHNQGTTADAQAFRTHPLEFMSHKRNRYGNLDVAQQHLLLMTGKYPKDKRGGKYIWAGNETHVGGVHVRDVDKTQELIRLQMRAYFPLDGIENTVYPGDAGDAIWSRSIFPDHLDFLTQGVDKIGSPVLYETAAKGWDKMLDITLKPMKVLTLEDVFNTNSGLYSEFINSGMGVAKAIQGDHYRWFVPMLKLFVARIASRYGDQTISGRRELRAKLVEQLRSSMESGLDLKKIDPGIQQELEAYIHLLQENKKSVLDPWAEIPEVLRPWTNGKRRNERIAYMKAWYKDKTGRDAPNLVDPKARFDSTSDMNLREFYDAIDEKIPLPDIIDRTANEKDTGEKK